MPEVKKENHKPETSGLSVAGLATGASGLVFIWWPGVNIILSILGIVFSGVALKKKQGQRGLAIAGLVTGIVGAALVISFWLFVVVLGTAIVGHGGYYDHQYYYPY